MHVQIFLIFFHFSCEKEFQTWPKSRLSIKLNTSHQGIFQRCSKWIYLRTKHRFICMEKNERITGSIVKSSFISGHIIINEADRLKWIMKIIIFYDGVKKYENIKPTLRSTRALLIMKKKISKCQKLAMVKKYWICWQNILMVCFVIMQMLYLHNILLHATIKEC